MKMNENEAWIHFVLSTIVAMGLRTAKKGAKTCIYDVTWKAPLTHLTFEFRDFMGQRHNFDPILSKVIEGKKCSGGN